MGNLSRPALVAATAVLIGFVGLVVVLLFQAGAEEQTWTRMAWLFSSVQAITLTAAGALFGASVQGDRADKAERRADGLEQEASNGRALAMHVLSDAPAEDGPGPGVESLGSDQRPADELARRHAFVARKLFPDLAGGEGEGAGPR
jgi:hypothetical protein